MPGLVNGHTHAHGALGKGMVGDRWPLELLLNANGAINAARTLEDKYLSAQLSGAEMISKGCTSAFDLAVEIPIPSVEGTHAVAQAYNDLGMRAVVAPMLSDRSFYQAIPGLVEAFPDDRRRTVEAILAAPAETSLAVCRTIFATWPFPTDRIRPAIAPTIPLHCSDDFLIGCDALAREFGLMLQTHLAESVVQAEAGRRRYGRSLLAHLDGLGLLSPHFSAAHALWIDEDDMGRLADRGAAVVHNPMSNLRLGSGIARAARMQERGVRLASGTDASNTSDGQNMFEAARLAAYLSRLEPLACEHWLSAGDVMTMATTGSADVLGFGDRIGRIAEGWAADIVFLDLNTANYLPLRAPLTQVAFTETGAQVESVMIAGRMVYAGRRHLTVDFERLRQRVAEAAYRLDEAVSPRLEAAGLLEEIVLRHCSGLRDCAAHGSHPSSVH